MNIPVVVYLSSDISDLLVPQPLPRSAVHDAASPMKAAEDVPQGAANSTTAVTAVAASVAAAMLVVSLLMVGNARRMRRRRARRSDEGVIIQDMPGFMEMSVSQAMRVSTDTNRHV